MMLRSLAFGLAGFLLSAFAAFAADKSPVSECQAIAQNLPNVTYASFQPPGPQMMAANTQASNANAANAKEEVKITFLGHATFFIETPGGVSIATDYSGAYPPPYLPDVVTMNKAHSTHYTLNPDPAIKHVLHGWSDTYGQPAKINMMVGDTLIRNVPSDIRTFSSGEREPNGNSIFIFEVAGLCIGHLGHLHYELTNEQVAAIGRLDVVMVPVDGGFTMGSDSMSRTVKRLRSSLILPMHRWGGPMDEFIARFGPDFDVMYGDTNSMTVSLKTLPKKPLIYVMKGV